MKTNVFISKNFSEVTKPNLVGRYLIICFILFSATLKSDNINNQKNDGSGNNITVIQKEEIKPDTSPEKTKSVVVQPIFVQPIKPIEKSAFFAFISNTNTIFILLISIATFIGLVYKGRS